LWNPENRIVWDGQALSIDLYESLVAFRRVDDQIIRTKNVYCPPDRLVGMTDLCCEFS